MRQSIINSLNGGEIPPFLLQIDLNDVYRVFIQYSLFKREMTKEEFMQTITPVVQFLDFGAYIDIRIRELLIEYEILKMTYKNQFLYL